MTETNHSNGTIKIQHVAHTPHKIEPLSRNELLFGGVSIIILMIFTVIFQLESTLVYQANSNGIFTEDELQEYHQLINVEFITEIQIEQVIFILTLPCWILYYIAIIRVFRICFPKYYMLREMFSFSYSLAVVFVMVATVAEIMAIMFHYEISDNEGNILPSNYMIQLTLMRMSTVMVIFAVYCGMISQNVLWIAILKASGIDLTYNPDWNLLVFPETCQGVFTKVCLGVLIFLNTFGAVATIFSWKSSGFWSVNGQASMLSIFTVICEFLSGMWLIWLATSKNYEKFNKNRQFLQF